MDLAPADVSIASEEYRSDTQALGHWFWHPDFIDPGNQLVFLPSQTLGNRMSWTDANADPEIIELRDCALVETDPDTRIEIFGAIQDYLQADGPWATFLQNGIQVGHTAAPQGPVYHPKWILDVAQLSETGP